MGGRMTSMAQAEQPLPDVEGLIDRFMQMRKMMGSLGQQGGLLSRLGGGGMPAMGGGLPGAMPPGGFDPSFGLGGGRGGATKKRQDPRAKKNKRKQQRDARKKKRKK